MLKVKETATFRKWMRKLKDSRARRLIATRIERLAFGLEGDVEPVGQGISEARIHYGPGYRIYHKKFGNTILLILCAGSKKTQQQDIDTAKRLAEEWSDD